ncbi:hypothetical protein [Brevibacillus borstelensis]|uniref:hypothetical protein n=1 Tax=Brevibacillus borstelensis TaxID=45462 RepID=UPI001D0B1817|nr:hypothetical protein [Brevibacillus borstelensis]MCC0566758.1 hypothetical protein [Brevibacillus borstelensis]
MNKKLVLSVLSTAVLTSMAASAMAKPSQGFYVGGEVDKYYSPTALLADFKAGLKEILSNATDTVYVNKDGKAANFLVAAEAEKMEDVLKPATRDLFEENDYAVVGSEGEKWNPADEDDWPVPGDITVESVSAINGTVTVVFDQELEAAPEAADLVVKQSINGADAVEVTPSAVTLGEDKKSVIVTVPAVEATDEEQTVVYSVSYKDGEAKAAEAFKVDAKDPQVDIVKAAEEAVAAYEGAALETLEDVATAEALGTEAQAKVDLVADADAKAAFQTRIDAQKAKVEEAKAKFTDAEIVAAAEAAVAAYEAATLTSLEEVSAAEALGTEAQAKVDLVADEEAKAEFQTRIDAQKAKVEEAKAKFTDAEIVAAAEAAVAAYEAASLTSLEEVATAEALGTEAQAKVDLVADADAKAAFQTRIDEQKAKVDAAKIALTPLEVRNIDSINKTIELNVAALKPKEDATAKVVIYALNEAGEKATKATYTASAAEIKDNVVTLDVSGTTFGDGEYAIVVTVDEEEDEVTTTIAFKEVEQLVSDIIAANKAKLASLLANDKFTDFAVANVDAYHTAKEQEKEKEGLKTVANVQKLVIDAVNAKAEAGAYFAEFKEKAEAVTSDYAKYTLLKAYFQYVNDENMDAYMDDVFEEGKVALADGDAVQNAVDTVNLDAVVANANVEVDADAKPSKLVAYKVALEGLQLVNKDTKDSVGNKTKATILEEIDNQLKAIATAQEKAAVSVKAANDALAAFEAAKGEGFADVEVYNEVKAAIAELQKEDLSVNALATTTLDGKVAILKEKTEELTIVGDTLDALAAFAKAFGEGADQETVYTDVTGQFVDFDGEDYSFADDKNIESLKEALAALKAETVKWEVYNAVKAAKTPAAMKDLLFEFGVDDFTNLSSAQKLEFAGRFIDAVAKDESADFNAVKELLGDELTAYAKLIDDVNGATTISKMQTALEAISDDYAKLGAKAKADIAETVLAGKPYGTIAAIVAAMGL